MTLVAQWLAPVFGTTPLLLHLTALINVVYGVCGFLFVLRPPFRAGRMRRLAMANLAWGAACVLLVVRQWADMTWLGLAWFAGEGLVVGALGVVELRALARAFERVDDRASA